ncbi:phosphatidylinositol mannoside acyltransferase [Streptomonospora wellingtoniae]|uniref:Phosphatidylinositol mannoside acyltransferase n=1 Tax=Streptomonospora wellingtoniae TaxID=3075544 RepID=A0ABU2KVN3_9ACTN|nr:phosphatidylinositol mannoside acyltransferase [Streptomonospora sp. DSM 45055]MDT0303318.1 phosphatidylinositol mannoside acyltransferase [Streptomonospora sp. DSM 45055]
MQPRERATTALYTAGWAVLRCVPERAGRAAFRAVADWSWLRRGPRVRRLEANLRRVAGPAAGEDRIRALSRAGMRSYLRYFYEMFLLEALGEKELRARVQCTGIERIDRIMAGGRGVVAALPHMGNWDLAGAWVTRYGIPLTTVAERLEPEPLFERFVSFREHLGMEVLPLTGGTAHSAGVLARRLLRGRFVCLLADRDLTESGVEVELFGEPARLPAGPAVLADRTGAALVPVSLWYEGGRMRVHVHEEVAPAGGDSRADRVRATTQRLARVFEQAIAEHPQDWHMLQRVFTADLDPLAGSGGEHDQGSVEEFPAAPPAAAPRRGRSRSRRRTRP